MRVVSSGAEAEAGTNGWKGDNDDDMVGCEVECGFALLPLATAMSCPTAPGVTAAAAAPDVPCPRRALSTDDSSPAALCTDPSVPSDPFVSRLADAARAGA